MAILHQGSFKGRAVSEGKIPLPYDRNYYKRSEYGFKSLERGDHKRILELVDFHNKRVLDIGCGYGALLRLIPTGPGLKYGVESNAYATKVCRGYNLKVRLHSRLDCLPFRRRFFDVVVMNEVIEHLENVVIILGEVKRILKRRGLLVITTPNKSLLVHNLEDTHVRELTYNELEKLVSNLGFSIVNHEVSGFSPYFFLGRYFVFPLGKFISKFQVLRNSVVGVRRTIDSSPLGSFRNTFVWLGTQQLMVAKFC